MKLLFLFLLIFCCACSSIHEEEKYRIYNIPTIMCIKGFNYLVYDGNNRVSFSQLLEEDKNGNLKLSRCKNNGEEISILKY